MIILDRTKLVAFSSKSSLFIHRNPDNKHKNWHLAEKKLYEPFHDVQAMESLMESS